jgi:hypothetical protein
VDHPQAAHRRGRLRRILERAPGRPGPAAELHHPQRRYQGPRPGPELHSQGRCLGLDHVGQNDHLPPARRGSGRAQPALPPTGDYEITTASNADFWGLPTWYGAPDPGWTTPRKPARFDAFGAVFDIPLNTGAAQIGYILHKGDVKDPGPDQILAFEKWDYEVWQLQGADVLAPYVLPILRTGGPNPGNLKEARAHWVTKDTLVWDGATTIAYTYKLCYAPTGGLQATDTGVNGGECIPLLRIPAGLPPDQVEKFPHLVGVPALKISAADLALVPKILKGQIAVSAVTPAGVSADATGVQIPGVLDDLYTYDGELGVSWQDGLPTIRVWAPTARSVSLHLFANSDPATNGTGMPMTYDQASGVWSITGEAGWKGQYYLYEVEVYVHSTGQVEYNLVTDPYSFSLAMNSTRSQIVDGEQL